MDFESKILPIMRDGIDVIKMILFKKLKPVLADRYSDHEPSYAIRLTGTITNQLFGVRNTTEPHASFARENQEVIAQELLNIAKDFEQLRIPLTDALRMQALCDHQDGIDSSEILSEAAKVGILIRERDLPLPHSFLHLVHKLGKAYGLLTPPPPDSGKNLEN